MESEKKFTTPIMECARNESGIYDCFSGNELLAKDLSGMVFTNLDPINAIMVVKSGGVDTVGIIGGSITCELNKNDRNENIMSCDSGGPDPEQVLVNGSLLWCLKDKFGRTACTGARGMAEAREMLAPAGQPRASSSRRRH